LPKGDTPLDAPLQTWYELGKELISSVKLRYSEKKLFVKSLTDDRLL